MHPFLVLGLGYGPCPSHPFLGETDVLVGGSRQLADFASLAPQAEHIPLSGSLDQCFRRMEEERNQGKRVTVLASGDPLFFGIGASLVRRFGADLVRIIPHVSSLQEAAARQGLAWDSIRCLSLHGRSDTLPLAHALYAGQTICVLTDPDHDPAWVARFLLDRGCDWYGVTVFEKLGLPEEAVRSLDLPEAAGADFASPNTLFLIPGPNRPALFHPGLPDETFKRTGNCLTKWPVRSALVAAMAIGPQSLVWDIGSGSGAVALEAACLAHQGQVVAIENRADRVANIRANRARFGAAHLDIVQGEAPDCLDRIPGEPDAILIGGGLGQSLEMADTLLSVCMERLCAGGRLTASCVLWESAVRFRNFAEQNALSCRILTLNCAEDAPLGAGTLLRPHTPVTILTVTKEKTS